MRTKLTKNLLLAGVLVIMGAAGAFSVDWPAASAQKDAPKEAAVKVMDESIWEQKKYTYFGADTCRQCHCQPGANKADFVKLDEYTTWRTEDKHSLAYAVLLGPRGRRMGELLAGRADYVLEEKAGCLNCHSMNYPGREGKGFKKEDGISCDGCHGPSSAYYAPHSAGGKWRTMTAEEKFALGMRDLRNPLVKARLCMSCHVGNAAEGKVVTHAMFAAGHPPLRGIELGIFNENLPKHWWDIKDVPVFKTDPALQKLYAYDTREFQNTLVAVVGSASAVAAQMNLAATRAQLPATVKSWPELSLSFFQGADNPADLWPQIAMAHSDCYACHHELVRPSWRQERGYGTTLLDGRHIHGIPGRPQMRAWSLLPFELSLQQTLDRTAYQTSSGEFQKRLAALYQTCNRSPFGVPANVQAACKNLRDWVDAIAGRQFNTARFDATDQLKLLRALCSLPESQAPDFETAQQIVAMLAVIYPEWSSRSGQGDARAAEAIQKLEEQLDSRPDQSRAQRKALILQLVQQTTKQKIDLSTPDGIRLGVFTMDLEEFRKKLFSSPTLEKLQALRDKDYEGESKVELNYAPDEFRKRLEELKSLLPRP
ncbi:MAG: hypothetical protein KatS3mg105_1841 [Gemmatales bacterium]|nr:MAG: hypothetical protein KatS3mg105_1841 [Gemmatales bacterium]